MPGRTIALLVAPLLALAAPLGAAQGEAFTDYWHQGEAEITSYELSQARYGEIHPGHAVLIFVTEDFSRERHVKLDRPALAGDDRVPVLKLNATRKFLTGIYPYSLMTSVFSPIDSSTEGGPLKVVTSSQEWCGQTFAQLNRTSRGWRVASYSYFESEGDRQLELPAVALEDEIWNRIRLAPGSLPTGEIEMLPGTVFVRLRHLPWEPQRARAQLVADGDLRVYRLEYPDIDRRLEIRFRDAFPHEIVGWTETTVSGWGPDARELVTEASNPRRLMVDYWTRNSLDDRGLREKLGLD